MNLPTDRTPPPHACGRWSLRALLDVLHPSARIVPSEPSQELRFTRSAQATHFALAAAICAATVLGLGLLSLAPWHADGAPFLQHAWLALLPLPLLLGFLWLAAYCSSHAYVILSPVGFEIFPFWFPGKNFRLIPWQDIRHVERRGNRLILDFGTNRGGVVLSLAPLRPLPRSLLWQATRDRHAQCRPR